MRPSAFVSPQQRRALLDVLGYTDPTGYVDFDRAALPEESLALGHAREHMDVRGTFGLTTFSAHGGSTPQRFRPLVYVAEAPDAQAAKELHRRVWSQGAVPLLLVLTPEEIWTCNGLAFSASNWPRDAQAVAWNAMSTDAALGRYHAHRLRSSLAWRDYAAEPSSRVDAHLLENLKLLSKLFASGGAGALTFPKLSTRTANALIGRFLYAYFLRDRKIIDDDWLAQHNYQTIDFENGLRNWSLDEMWSFFDRLDRLFNGSIFPLSPAQRRRIQAPHVQLLREVLRHDYQPHSAGTQIGFLNVYFPVLRTETLSAVYEHFLEAESPDRKADEGAFYTPPFLADYVLDELEQILVTEDGVRGFAPGVRVLDGAAGSGVFLVGAFRRMIERALRGSHRRTLPAEQLRLILRENIFAIEKRGAACHVAAFSLYLTLLDYASAEDIRAAANGDGTCALFPPLIGRNILIRDFFGPRALPAGFPEKVDCVVGNPPWKKIGEIHSWQAVRYSRQHHREMPIDHNRAAELFAWKCARSHLRDGGVMGMLLSVKSFISPSARHFIQCFSEQFQVVGVANFAHFRYKMFTNSRAAAAAIFARHEEPQPGDAVWTYSPTLASQPVRSGGSPWAIVVDRAEVSNHRYASIVGSPRGWFEALMLRPIDRRAYTYLSDFCLSGRGATLGQLEKRLKLAIGRGGSRTETGISEQYLLDAGEDEDDGNNYLRRLKLGGSRLIDTDPPYNLPDTERANVTERYKSRFGGHILLIPRNGKKVHYVKEPIAFKSTLFALSFQEPCRSISRQKATFLRAVARYLNSSFFQYLMTVCGRQWMLDGRRFDTEDLRSVPLPITGFDDDRNGKLLLCSDDELTSVILDLFAMPDDLRWAVRESFDLRLGFKDGGIPSAAVTPPGKELLANYRRELQQRLDGFVGSRDAFSILVRKNLPRDLGVVVVTYMSPGGGAQQRADTEELLVRAMAAYDTCGVSVFTDSLFIHYDRSALGVVMIKPLLGIHWTVERAFFDGGEVLGRVLSSGPRLVGGPDR